MRHTKYQATDFSLNKRTVHQFSSNIFQRGPIVSKVSKQSNKTIAYASIKTLQKPLRTIKLSPWGEGGVALMILFQH